MRKNFQVVVNWKGEGFLGAGGSGSGREGWLAGKLTKGVGGVASLLVIDKCLWS